MRRIFVVLFALVLVGCSARANTVPTPQDWQFVREIDVSQGGEVLALCEFLGGVQGDASPSGGASLLAGFVGETPPPDLIKAMNQIRAQTANLGGDSFVTVAASGYTLQAEAYNCGMEIAPVAATVQGQ